MGCFYCLDSLPAYMLVYACVVSIRCRPLYGTFRSLPCVFALLSPCSSSSRKVSGLTPTEVFCPPTDAGVNGYLQPFGEPMALEDYNSAAFILDIDGNGWSDRLSRTLHFPTPILKQVHS
jgi:hypothetical protein